MKDTPTHLQDQVHQAIDHSPYLVRKRLRCETEQGRVVLKGEVNSYYQKQMATAALRQIHGVEQIDNQLEVIWP